MTGLTPSVDRPADFAVEQIARTSPAEVAPVGVKSSTPSLHVTEQRLLKAIGSGFVAKPLLCSLGGFIGWVHRLGSSGFICGNHFFLWRHVAINSETRTSA
jgi:hypothetical protein